ncbi:hypothetical protein NP233_g135 [Leucocoprinus birnbaumii]|uniref:F-box domain-containing protein n=1 Tax=Leucocoprinus birnbaumii TaxID=56174 RepID=A0AAD5YWY4_9AGAR|nr:hypothetical protein NP233_g135 [Leucocoprinus birnbaumii]
MAAPLPSGDTQIHSAQDEIKRIQSEISAVDRLISQLYEKRAALSQRLNDVQSTTRILPPEILSRIFINAYDPPCIHTTHRSDNPPHPMIRKSACFPITLSHVCVIWRAVAYSTPSIWTYMNASLFESPDTVARILHMHLINVKSLPFHLNLPTWREPSQQITSLLFDHDWSKRIRSLTLSEFPFQWAPTFSQRFSGLTDLHIESYRVPPELEVTFSFSEIPLRKLHLADFRDVISLPLATLEDLHLQCTDMDVCIAMLIQCPDLIRFQSNMMIDRARSPQALQVINSSLANGRPAVFRLMEYFSWERGTVESANNFIRRLRLPRLKEFCWSEYHFWDHIQDLCAFAPNLPQGLDVVTLSLLPTSDRIDTNSVFETLPSGTRHLKLDRCRRSTVISLISQLRWEGERRYFPALAHLSIDATHTSPITLEQYMSERLLEIVEARFVDGACKQFSFKFSFVKIRWTPEARSGLCNLVAQGLDLSIVEDDTPVKWLS